MMVPILSARVLGFLVGTLLLVGPSWVRGQADVPFELQWSAPADCPEGSQIRQEVVRLAGTSGLSRQLEARVRIRQDERQGWALDLTTELDGIVGERHLAGVSCQSLSEAATLTLALLLNPEAKIENPPAPPAPPAVQASPAPEAPRRAKPGVTPVWQTGVLAGLQVGVLSEPSPWLGLSLGAGFGRFWLRLAPGFTPPQKLSSRERADAGGRLWLVSAAVLGCYAAIERIITLTPCLGANMVRLHGEGWGVLEAREASVYWTSAELALLAGLPLGRVMRLELWGFGVTPLYKSGVYLEEAGLISRPAGFGFGARAGLAAVWR